MNDSNTLEDYVLRRADMATRAIPGIMNLLLAKNPWFVAVDALKTSTNEAGGAFASFAHYDYLSLSAHPRVIEAGQDALLRYGAGAGASRLVGGERTVHRQLEREMASFLGQQAALCLPAGYLVSMTLIPHLMTSNDLIVIDSLSHNSIVNGCKASRAKMLTFRHGDLDHLEEILKRERSRFRACLIVVEGLYSMDGDIVDLPRVIELKKRWNSWLMVDEAHSIGVLGKTGRGICEHFDIAPGEVDIVLGTLSKSFVSMGGFLGGRRILIEWLKLTLPGFVFSAGLSPVLTATALAALRVLRDEPERVERLTVISRYFLDVAQAAGIATGPAIGKGIVPLLFDRQETTLAVSQRLAEAGIYVPPVIRVGVPTDAPRIRFFLSADTSRPLVERTFGVLKSALSAEERAG
ncbi:MAG: aminotransferase class I/II-fold pyridoxal phosphate-dependent enzyme [Shinella zoogloeoides]|uniref:aminotransferase class I/II-fold pyridoxal phosphate-dependent enzyme n=1 Tax=Shinella zoogloeoides TaxID=352475 RepID=UPI003C792ABB